MPGACCGKRLEFRDDLRRLRTATEPTKFSVRRRSSFGRSWVTVDGGTTWSATEHPEPINALWDVALLP